MSKQISVSSHIHFTFVPREKLLVCSWNALSKYVKVLARWRLAGGFLSSKVISSTAMSTADEHQEPALGKGNERMLWSSQNLWVWENWIWKLWGQKQSLRSLCGPDSLKTLWKLPVATETKAHIGQSPQLWTHSASSWTGAPDASGNWLHYVFSHKGPSCCDEFSSDSGSSLHL